MTMGNRVDVGYPCVETMERWTNQYRSVSTRPAGEDEKAEIRQRVKSAEATRRRLIALTCAGIALMAGGMAVAVLWNPAGGTLMVAGLIAVMYGSLHWRDSVRLRQRFESELEESTVDQFELLEHLRPRPRFDVSEKGISEGDVMWRFEALRPTGRMIVEGAKANRDCYVDVRSVASSRREAMASGMPPRIDFVRAVKGVVLRSRDLSTDEVDEIRAIADRYSLRYIQGPVLGFCWCLLGVIVCVAQRDDPNLQLFGIFFYGSICAALWYFNGWRWTKGRLWMREAREQTASTLPISHPMYSDVRASKIEVLPITGALWTIDDEPADWRLY